MSQHRCEVHILRQPKERIVADLAEHRLDLTARKEILWDSETATNAEVPALEVKLILETGANNPAVGLQPHTTVVRT